MPHGDPASEPAVVQGFISARQAGVLERAIVTLRECPADELSAQAHRLSGTLGTYQLGAASVAVRRLYDEVRADDAVPAVIDRKPTIDVLQACLDSLAVGTEVLPT